MVKNRERLLFFFFRVIGLKAVWHEALPPLSFPKENKQLYFFSSFIG